MLQWILLWCICYTFLHLAETRVDFWVLLKVSFKVLLTSLVILGARLLAVHGKNLLNYW